MNIKKTVSELFAKYRELILYFGIGIITTVINFAVYYIMKDVFLFDYITANIIAWFVSVISAYITNKIWVFDSIDCSFRTVFCQFLSFAGFRVFSGAAETLLIYIFVDCFMWSENIVKIPVAVIVVVSNYLFSKLFVFKKK